MCPQLDDPVTSDDELQVARERFPLGAHVTGTIAHIPQPGAIGLFVDLGESPQGFVDVLHLPRLAERWPSVGSVSVFEVIRHSHGQVRLWPLGPRFQDPDCRIGRSEAEWDFLIGRYPVGTLVVAKVEAAYAGNECTVSFDDHRGLVEWTGTAPPVGHVTQFRVLRHLNALRVLLLQPLDHPSLPGADLG